MPTQFEFSPKSNLWVTNNVDISDALFIWSLSERILKSQYEEGARDVNNIWVPEMAANKICEMIVSSVMPLCRNN